MLLCRNFSSNIGQLWASTKDETLLVRSKLPVTASTFTLNHFIFVGIAFSVWVPNWQDVFHTGYDVCDLTSLLDISAMPTNISCKQSIIEMTFFRIAFTCALMARLEFIWTSKYLNAFKADKCQLFSLTLCPSFEMPDSRLRLVHEKHAQACSCRVPANQNASWYKAVKSDIITVKRHRQKGRETVLRKFN